METILNVKYGPVYSKLPGYSQFIPQLNISSAATHLSNSEQLRSLKYVVTSLTIKGVIAQVLTLKKL
jgi:hypothetical protein